MRSKKLPIDVAYAKLVVGDDNFTAMAYKMKVSDHTTRMMIRTGLAYINTIHAFCTAYKADAMKLVLKKKPAAEKPAEEPKKDPGDAFTALAEILQEQTKVLAELMTIVSANNELLVKIADYLATAVKDQQDYGEHEKRYHACTYKTLKELKEKWD